MSDLSKPFNTDDSETVVELMDKMERHCFETNDGWNGRPDTFLIGLWTKQGKPLGVQLITPRAAEGTSAAYPMDLAITMAVEENIFGISEPGYRFYGMGVLTHALLVNPEQEKAFSTVSTPEQREKLVADGIRNGLMSRTVHVHVETVRGDRIRVVRSQDTGKRTVDLFPRGVDVERDVLVDAVKRACFILKMRKP